MLIIMERVLDLVDLDLFLVIDRLLQVYQLFLIAHQQNSDRNLASKIFLSVLLSEGQNLSVEVIGWLYGMLLFNNFGCSDLMLNVFLSY